MTKTPIATIPEERVAAILARAAELDRERKETISVDAIRAAAVDAGISAAAVDEALQQYVDGEFPAPAEPESKAKGHRFARLRPFVRKAFQMLKVPLKLGTVFFVVGLTGAAGEGMVVLAWAAWLLISAGLVLKQRAARRAIPFGLAMLYMTVGLMLGFAAGEVEEEAIVFLIPVGLMVLAAGAVAIKARLPRPASAGTELEVSTG